MEPTRPKNMKEVIEIFTEVAREYYKEHPEKLVTGTKGEMDTTGLEEMFRNLDNKEQKEE